MISDRQQKLLRAIINEFIDTAEAVGSTNLQQKYGFSLSSATIRNEMAELVFNGYLYKKHSSAGRIPTTKGWKFFVDGIGDEISLPLIDTNQKTSVISALSKFKGEKSKLIRQGLNFLSMISENCTVALIENEIYYSGLSNLPNIPEMQEGDMLKRILLILEDYYTLSDIFNKNISESEINILIGEEDTGNEIFKDYSVIYSELRFAKSKGFIAVIGPNRIKYDKVVSSIKFISDTIKYIVKDE